MEPVIRGIFEEFGGGRPVTQTFPRIPFAESMLKYGSDKPDLRNPLVIVDVTEEFSREDVSFKAFKGVIAQGGVVRAIPATNAGAQPRSFFDKLNDWAKGEGAAGLGYIIFEGEAGAMTGKGPIAKFLPPEAQSKIAEKCGLKPGDAVFFACDQAEKATKLAGAARLKIGLDLGLTDLEKFELCWIVDFPMFEWDEDEKKVDFSHNPFSMPQGGLEALTTQDPLTIKAFQYDIACNGYELASGGIRNHRPEAMVKAFEIAGYSEQTVIDRFGGMYRAFQYGAPPHGGMAAGVDRIIMLLARVQNLREISLFPMNQRAEDLLMGAPSDATPKQLRELHIRLNLPEAKG
jgi:aspartyl-tRNA synthetase